MNKRTKHLLSVFIISIVLSLLVVVAFLLEKEQGDGKLLSSILLPVWVFSIIPAYMYIYQRLKSKNFNAGFYIGSFTGVAFGAGCIIIPVIIAPFIMPLYYYNNLFN